MHFRNGPMSELSWGSGPTQYFFDLTPDKVMSALEREPVLGVKQFCTGYCQPLASFENRVYEIEFEDKKRAVAKFYRPGRWSETQILEEHQFMQDILDAEIPVVVPHYFSKPHDTLRKTEGGLFYCVYPKVGGRQPEDLPPEKLEQLGRLIARMHTVGIQKKAPSRVVLSPESYGQASLDYLLESQVVSANIENRFADIVENIIDQWQKISFTLDTKNFDINQKKPFEEFVIVFDDQNSRPKTGRILIDEVEFSKS